MATEKILVIDDDQGLLTLMNIRLSTAGYEVTLAHSGEEALAQARDETFDLAIADLKMADMDGVTLLSHLLRIQPSLPVIILTAHGSIASAVEATKKGACDYLSKPFDPHDLLHRIEKTLEVQRLKAQIEQLHTLVQQRYDFENIVAVSDTMQRTLQEVAQIAVTDASVALYGESGTGKELIAKTIHAASHRCQGAFVTINCGAIPEGLLENELFGHARGAYTGADQSKRGLLKQADGGTLFLDEIADLPLALQVKLLRVLQEYEFVPLGAEQPIKVDFRLITATNQDLWKAVQERRFREDLYYRIHVVPLVLPPLRERPEDIPVLAEHFLTRLQEKFRKDVRGFAPESLQRLMLYKWPGNIRELANVIERAMVLATHDVITADLLLLGKEEPQNPHAEFTPLKIAREDFERTYLIQVLSATKGNISRAAKLAGKYRGDFYKLLRKHIIDPRVFKQDANS
jgi:two-component system response regulator GlrR